MTGMANALLDWARQLPAAGLYTFIFVWLFVESTGFPISDEPLLLLAGYLTTHQRIEFGPTIALALAGKVLASCAAYGIGTRVPLSTLARPAVRPGKGWARLSYYLRPTRELTFATEDQFRRRGMWSVFLGRLIPVVRSFISYPAGSARMPFLNFFTATAAGSLIWITIWTLLGILFGRSYEQVAARWGSLSWLVLSAIVLLLIGFWLWQHRHARSRNERSNGK
jgi:alkaline phosphatase